jgi:hypothetical protein
MSFLMRNERRLVLKNTKKERKKERKKIEGGTDTCRHIRMTRKAASTTM